VLARYALLALALSPAVAHADHAQACFLQSDRSTTYVAAVKPLVDAVNAVGKGLVEIVLYSRGVLGRDIAFAVPGYSPERFSDNSGIELPGLFYDTREGTEVYTRLTRIALKRYEDFVVN
jgi:hypothetical protein